MLKDYDVCMESKTTVHLKVQAKSLEDAVRVACLQRDCKLDVYLNPTAVGLSKVVEDEGVYTHNIEIQCDNCERWLLDRTMPDWPWNYTLGEDGYGIFCYECAVKKGLAVHVLCDDSHPAVGSCVLPKDHKGVSHKTKAGVTYRWPDEPFSAQPST